MTATKLRQPLIRIDQTSLPRVIRIPIEYMLFPVFLLKTYVEHAQDIFIAFGVEIILLDSAA